MASRNPTDALTQEEADRVRDLLSKLREDDVKRVLGVCEVTAVRMTIPGRRLHAYSVREVREHLAAIVRPGL